MRLAPCYTLGPIGHSGAVRWSRYIRVWPLSVFVSVCAPQVCTAPPRHRRDLQHGALVWGGRGLNLCVSVGLLWRRQ